MVVERETRKAAGCMAATTTTTMTIHSSAITMFLSVTILSFVGDTVATLAAFMGQQT